MKQKPKPLPKPKAVKAKPIQDNSNMEKGNVKLKKGETVFVTRKFYPKKQRHISINDGKNTVVTVSIEDKRTDEQIREQYLK